MGSAVAASVAGPVFERAATLTRESARWACARCKGIILAEVRAGDLCGGCGAELETVHARPKHANRIEPDPAWQPILTRYGGLNVYGEPNIRITWAPARLGLEGGLWTERDEHGNYLKEVPAIRRVPIYEHIGERWVLELWHPANKYGSPETWDLGEREPTTGLLLLPEFPSRGDYEWLWTCEAEGKYLAPTAEILFTACKRVEISRGITYDERRRAGMRRAEKRDEEHKKFESDYIDDQCWRAFHLRPFVSMAGSKSQGRRA